MALREIDRAAGYHADVNVPVGIFEQRERREQRGIGEGEAPLSALAALFVLIIRATFPCPQS